MKIRDIIAQLEKTISPDADCDIVASRGANYGYTDGGFDTYVPSGEISFSVRWVPAAKAFGMVRELGEIEETRK